MYIKSDQALVYSMGGKMMTFFYTINGTRFKRMLIICLALIFTVGILYSEKDSIAVFSYNKPSVIYAVPTDQKLIALTFNISWGDKRVEPLLKVLEEQQVHKATFFVSSIWAQAHPDLLQLIIKAGYEVGSLGHEYKNYSSLKDTEVLEQIQTAHEVLTSLMGKEPKLIRMPNGNFNKQVVQIAHDLDYQVIQWHTNSNDWLNPGVDKIVNRVVKNAYPGDIVLMHASDASEQIHEALPMIIAELRQKGYDFVQVSGLLQQTIIQQEPLEDLS